MKRVVIPLAIMVLILGGSLYNSFYVKDFTREIIVQLNQAQELVADEDWDKATTVTEKAYQDWQDKESYLYIFMRHNTIDDVLRTFRDVQQYLHLEELDQYAAANCDLVTQLELLAEMEQPSVGNVL